MDYDKLIAPAAKAMRPSGIRKFFDLAAEMPECISLGVGEPDFKTPWAVREAGIESLEHGRTRYTSNAGLKELRAEISRYLERRMNLRYDPMRQILVTVGGSEAIDMCIRTLVKPGDEVIIPEPCFVCYEPITTLSGGVPVHVACRQEDEFRLRADALKAAITPKTKLVIMPFPNNPTGAVMEREDLEAVAEVLRGTDIMVLSDEIYAELNYGLRPHVSIATLPGMAERTIVVNGFSKSYAMTGWRLGYACGPAPIIKIMTKIHQSAIMSAPTTSQYAAITALKECDGEIDRMRDEYNMRRRLVVRSFSRPSPFTQPLMISLPGCTKRGLLSPVRAAVSTSALPSSTVPSRWIFSPGSTTMVWPGCTVSGSASVRPSFACTRTVSGFCSSIPLMDLRLFCTARLCKNSPTV